MRKGLIMFTLLLMSSQVVDAQNVYNVGSNNELIEELPQQRNMKDFQPQGRKYPFEQFNGQTSQSVIKPEIKINQQGQFEGFSANSTRRYLEEKQEFFQRESSSTVEVSFQKRLKNLKRK